MRHLCALFGESSTSGSIIFSADAPFALSYFVCNLIVPSFLLLQINAAAEVIYEAVDPNANIIFGSLVDPSMNGEVAITVIATGGCPVPSGAVCCVFNQGLHCIFQIPIVVNVLH